MALTNTGSNRFGPSSYIVGPVLGDGCNFTLVGDAIAQAVADGHTTANPTTILVRPGTYSSFTMAPGIQVEGVCAGSAFSNSVAIVGNITIDSTTAGGTSYALKNLNVSDPADAVIIQGVGPAIFVDIANCSINGTRGLVVGNTSGTLSQFALRECRIIGSSIAVDLQLHNTVFSEQSTYQGGTVFAMSGDSRAALFDCVLDATVDYGFQMTGSVNRVNLNYTNITSPLECIIGTNNGETVQVTHCIFTSSAASGNYIDAVDIYEFYDLPLKGTALLNNAVATNFIDWTPHADTAANATLPGGVRGTASFDSGIFTVTDGWVTHTAGPPASTFPVDNGGPGVPLAGSMSFLGATSVDFPIPSGIETHVGATTNEIYLEDRRWLSAFVVDPSATVGLRGTFTTVQAAITAAGLGPSDIFIRPGIYTENLAITGNVNLIGTAMSGQLDPSALAQVMIIGDHTVSGQGLTVCQGIRFISSGANFTIDDGTGPTPRLQLIHCSVDSTGANCAIGGTGIGEILAQNTQFTASGRNISVLSGTVMGNYDFTNCSFFSSGDLCIAVDAAVSSGFVRECTLLANGASPIFFDLNSAGATLVLEHSSLTGPTTASITFQAAASVSSYHNTFDPSGNSEYITGPGNYTYCDDAVVGGYSSSGIDGAATQTILGWRPWATASAGPAPGALAIRGTSAFDSSHFALTDGFVQLLSTAVATQYVTDTGTVMPVANSINMFGGPGVTVTGAGDTITVNSVVWSDTGVNQLVDVDEGSFATAGITLTLPAAPTIGEECRFVVATGGSLTIQANAGQTIHIGNMASSVAGTASSTDTGDFVTLTAQSATEWWATGVIGNWTLA